jgi:hypothetical protein
MIKCLPIHNIPYLRWYIPYMVCYISNIMIYHMNDVTCLIHDMVCTMVYGFVYGFDIYTDIKYWYIT